MKKTLLLLVILATMLFAETGKEAWMDELGLSDEQIEKIDGLSTQWQKDRIDLEASVKKAQLSLDETIKGDASRAELEKTFENLSDAKMAYEKAQFEHVLDVRDELTDAQKEKFTPNMGGIMKGQHKSASSAKGCGAKRSTGSGMHQGCGKH